MSNTTTFPYGASSIQLIIKSETEYWLQANNLESGNIERFPVGSRVQIQLVEEPMKLYSISSDVNLPNWPYKEISVSSKDLLSFRLTPEDPDFVTGTITYLKAKKHATYSWDLTCCESIYLYIADGEVPTFYVYYSGNEDCPCFTEFGNL